jgi:glycosyltransferase involved in cell wall biosynthesis
LVERRSFDSSVLPQLRSLVRERRPHIVQTHNMKSHLLVCLLGLEREYPWIAVHHGYTATSLRDRLYRFADRWSLRRACRVLTVCNAFVADMRRAGVPAARIVVEHNAPPDFLPVAPGEVDRLRERLSIPEGVPVILALGRLSREKGHRDLIEAAAILRDRRPALPFRLVLAGDGPERARLESACRRLGLQDAVVLAGHQPDVRPFYAMARLLALPSHSEGSPNVVLEAMAAGVPLAATAVGGIPEIVRDGVNGLLVPPRDPGRMAGAMARLLEERSLADTLSTAARNTVAEDHSPDRRRVRLLRLYRDVLDSVS